jgi:hypothetical protein
MTVLLTGCGEPAVDVDIPQRPDGAHVLDLAGVLDAEALERDLVALAGSGLDVVALTYETEQAGCGEAFRAGSQFVEAWDADVALVAVAKPGDFAATAETRVRCLGVQPRDPQAVPGGVREQIAEELVPPFAERNDWTGAFAIAVDTLAQQ